MTDLGLEADLKWVDSDSNEHLIGQLYRTNPLLFLPTTTSSSATGADATSPGEPQFMVHLDGSTVTVQTTLAGQASLTVDASFDYADAGDENLTITGSGLGDIVALGRGNNTVIETTGNNIIFVKDPSTAGSNTIHGGVGYDTILGGQGNDKLIGGGGADDMFGGLGNDTYSVDNASDLVGEPFGGGFDTVRSSLPAYVLADTLEALILDPGATWAIGNGGDNTLVGNAISNYLIGYGGNDSLFGIGNDTSNDTMIGGLGDDTYQLDSAGDEAIENAGEGSDLIISEAPSYTLPSNLEAMFLGGAGVWGFGNESDNTLAGTLGNYLFGRGGNDYLNGGGGGDYLEGGAGADVFLFARGEANGEAVADFTPGQDRLGFIGYGLGGTFTQIDATHWAVNSADGTTHEIINLLNAPTITSADFFFIQGAAAHRSRGKRPQHGCIFRLRHERRPVRQAVPLPDLAQMRDPKPRMGLHLTPAPGESLRPVTASARRARALWPRLEARGHYKLAERP